ncbi:hypothetical protein [Pararcticibacter amylolyticus]|uniref:Peptidase S74 domain-containing protein n=1 Tax=Pararcticibacter amylolyticus TaxID=2173175 RepID=A0A2U2P9L2_9SPHI|nr:hypothetical protein [Pararcticibacter amylolyticus]PWG78072.1 hypothetical protein DDR33_24175 [Pararcticibacter amylolyticus]
MKTGKLLSVVFFFFLVFRAGAQNLPTLEPNKAAIGCWATYDAFTYDSHPVGHYSIGWYSDSWDASGPTAYFSSYGGLKFFTWGVPRVMIHSNGMLDVAPPTGNGAAATFHLNGGQSWGNVLTLATDSPDGDDPRLLFSYRNKSKQWSIGGNYNSRRFSISENTGDGVYGNEFGIERLTVNEGGNVGIGTANPSAKLTVAGNIESREVKVSVDAGADYVFNDDYGLKPLSHIEAFVKTNRHLPEIASAAEMQKDGLNLGEMNIKLLKKVEELTLYLIEKEKEIQELRKSEKAQKKETSNLTTRIEQLERLINSNSSVAK